MPRRAILLVIAAASVLVSTTLGASADPQECAVGCGGYFRIPQGGKYYFSVKASDDKTGQPLAGYAHLPTGTVVRFDARLTTFGRCREVWCNSSPHCGRGSDLNDLYNAHGLWIEDENGSFKAGFWEDTEQSIGSTPEHPTKITLNQPGTYYFRIRGHMDPTECRFDEYTPDVTYIFGVDHPVDPCEKCSAIRQLKEFESVQLQEECFTDQKLRAQDRCKFLYKYSDSVLEPDMIALSNTTCWTTEYFGSPLGVTIPLKWVFKVILPKGFESDPLRKECVSKHGKRLEKIEDDDEACKLEAELLIGHKCPEK